MFFYWNERKIKILYVVSPVFLLKIKKPAPGSVNAAHVKHTYLLM